VGEEGMLGGEITITTASAQRGFYSVYATNCYEYFILALWFIHVQPNDLLPYGIVQGFFFFFFFLNWFPPPPQKKRKKKL